MKEKLIGLVAATAAAPAAVFSSGIESASAEVLSPSSHQIFLSGSQQESLRGLHLSDLPGEMKVVVTLAALSMVAGGVNKWQRGKDYGSDFQKDSDKAVAVASAALGAGIVIATWYPF